LLLSWDVDVDVDGDVDVVVQVGWGGCVQCCRAVQMGAEGSSWCGIWRECILRMDGRGRWADG